MIIAAIADGIGDSGKNNNHGGPCRSVCDIKLTSMQEWFMRVN